MPRYFIEVGYRGTRFSGFQIQENAVTVQSEVESAFRVLHRQPVTLTGSSRTDAGVHAIRNYFHFDFEEQVNAQFIYKMNAILPDDIVVRRIILMPELAHARFDATGRHYEYRLHRFKNPFLRDRSLYYPFTLDRQRMDEAAAFLKEQTNFFAFAKTNTQVKNFHCTVFRSEWKVEGEELVFYIGANRFLRGMVRLLTASIIKVGRGKLPMEVFQKFFEGGGKCGHSVPAHGLYLVKVTYPENYFPATDGHLTGF